MGTKNLKDEISKSILEDEERIRDITDEKEKFLANKGMTEKVKSVAELEKADSERKSNFAKAMAAIVGAAATVGTFLVELYKARNKDKTNQKILDNQINIMEQYERNVFDNRGN